MSATMGHDRGDQAYYPPWKTVAEGNMAAFVSQPLVLDDLAHGVKFEDDQARFPRASACDVHLVHCHGPAGFYIDG